MLKSSRKAKRQILGVISVARAEQMLREWVNTDLAGVIEDARAWERFFRRYPEVLLVPLDSIIPYSDANFEQFHQQMEIADSVAHCLRSAWDAPDQRTCDWYTWRAQHEYEYEAASVKYGLVEMERKEDGAIVWSKTEDRDKMERAIHETDEPPAVITAVEAISFYLRHNRNNALHCPNPTCPAPYFFRSKKSQKFCSPECAKPSLRESKRAWWAANRAKEKP
jgi:hypothetical protein